MSNEKYFSDAVDFIATLYELSLKIGTSLDLEENCQTFLDHVLLRCDFSAGAVFVDDSILSSDQESERERGSFRCVYCVPSPGSSDGMIGSQISQRITDRLAGNKWFSNRSEEMSCLLGPSPFQRILKLGVAVVYRLGDCGFLLLVNGQREELYSAPELNRFSAIVDKFAISVDACAHHELVDAHREQLKQQFLQAQKMEALGRLTGGIAHDFNNLLTVINAQSELQLMVLDEDHQAYRLATGVLEAGTHAADLTSQLLVYSRQSVTDPKVFCVSQAISSMEQLLGRLLGEQVLVKTKLQANANILADSSQVEQAIMNLAINARDAMPEGGKLMFETAVVELQSEHEIGSSPIPPGKYVQLKVTDTGIGIPESNIAKIFDPYFSTKGVGSGLGLSVVQGAVQEADGHIFVKSEPGVGTEFSCYYPCSKEALAEREPVSGAKGNPGTETILLVEDELAVLNTVATALTMFGYRVLAASEASQARALAKAHGDEISLLLSDVIMPDVNGKELAADLLQEHPQWKLLFMSGYTDSHFQGLDNVKVNFIQKPFSMKAITSKIGKILHEPDEQTTDGQRMDSIAHVNER